MFIRAIHQYRPFFDSDSDGGGNTASKDTKNDADQRGKSGGGKGDDTPTLTQEDFDFQLSRRLRQQEKSIRKELEEEIRKDLEARREAEEAEKNGDVKKQLESANATIEKLEKRIGEYEQKEAEEERKALRREIAKKYKLPDDDEALELITGETEEDMKKSAKVLAKYAKVDDDDPPDLDQGRSTTGKKKEREKKAYDDPNYWGIQR